jgi:arylsulfatase A-like enzyme
MRAAPVVHLASTALLMAACRNAQRPAAPAGEHLGPEGPPVATLERPAPTCPDDPGCQDAGARAKANPPRPALPELSFLFITVDTLRPDLGYAAYSRPVSPNIDELAKKATIYERAYSISTYTAFAVPPMMASRYPSEMPRSDRHEVRYFGKNVLLAERLRDAGFHTAAAASHFLFGSELGWTDGIEHFVMTGAEGNAPKGAHIDHRHSSRPLADAAIRFLEDPEIVSGRFFIWVHFLDPHKQYLEHPGFSNFGSDPRALYDGEIAFTDHHIGRVLRALASSPAANRTAVVFTGDHGEAFGEHGFSYHGREIWDEVVRIPLFVYVPGMDPHVVSRRVSSVDIVPTVLDLAGIPPDPEARGQSLTPEIFGGELAPRPLLVDQPRNPYYLPKRGFIDGAHKLHHLIDSDTYLLFDLDRDPGETNDLAGDPALLSEVQRSYVAFTSKIVDFTPKRTIPYPSDKRSSRTSGGLASTGHMP